MKCGHCKEEMEEHEGKNLCMNESCDMYLEPTAFGTEYHSPIAQMLAERK